MSRRQRSSVGAPSDIPRLVNENGKVSELVETNDVYVTCYTEHPLWNWDILDFKCDQWNKGLSEIFLTYKQPTSASKLSVGPQKITFTGKSAYFILEIKDRKLRVIEKKSGNMGKEETLTVEEEPCWVCFRLRRSRIKMLSPALRDRTTVTSFERSESDFVPTPTDESSPVVTPRNSGSLESAQPPSLRIRRASIAIIQFAQERLFVVNQEIEERQKQEDIIDADLRDLTVQLETLLNQVKRTQVERSRKLALLHEVQAQIKELKHEQGQTRQVLENDSP